MPDDPKAALYRYRFGSAEFDEARFELRVSGLPVDVQRKPLEVLAFLLAHAGEVVTKEELMDTVWQGRPTVENVVANAIAKLRSALGPEGAERIITQPRVGYRFNGPLERTAVGRSLLSLLELAPGMNVPARSNFILESQLSGHDSEVWMARHGKTGELRVYKFSSGGERLSALKREATLYRVLRDNLGERPDIARVIDWNFETPPYFLECEYVGSNLAEWSRSEADFAAMPLAGRLGLFLQIADAVAAAHGVGVLHKDLKPANVLIYAQDVSWQPCLSDFGSGRLLESERLGDITGMGLTVTGGVLTDSGSGTPQYLAPELLAGQPPTVQSDLYALGIMLYQFVIGDLRKPMVSGWERGVEDVLLRADLAATTDGDPSRRLAGVPELTHRLRNLEARHQERRRFAAADLAAREAKQAMQRSRARRPWVLTAMLALTVGLGASLWLYRQASIAGGRLEAMNDFLYKDVLANTGALKTDTDPDPGMRRVLRNASEIVGERFAGDPGSEGWIRYGVGQGLSGLGDYPSAEQQQRLAVELLTSAHGPADERTLLASRGLAMLLLEQSKFDEAEAVLSDVDVISGAAIQNNEESVFVMQALRGMLRAARKDCAAALEDLRQAERIPLPPSSESAYNLFNVRSWVGETLNCLGRHDEALVHYEELLGADNDEEILGPALIAYARLGHASALLHQGRHGPAEQELLDALDILETTIGDADAFTMGQALVVAGDFYADLGDLDRAIGYLERGRDLLLAVDEHQEKALNALRLLGTIDYCNGDLERARSRLAAAHAAFTERYGADSPDAQGAGFWLAASLLEAGETATAAELAATLDPAALDISLGGTGWDARLDALQSWIRTGQAGDGQCPVHERSGG
jgi:eukaryotic-like serine/threonine-protein kinase